MYVPAHFQATDEQLRAMLADPGLVELVTPTPDGLVATPLPMLFQPGDPADPDELGVLQGHVARNNPHWRAAASAIGQSLAILRGPDAYVSPSWYPSKAEHGRVVPTWNYLTVHLHGRLVAHESTDWLSDLVTRLTAVHEAAAGLSWQPSDAPADFLAGQLRAIVGVELRVSRIEAKAKLSQNRPAADHAAVLDRLASRDQPGPNGVAALMRDGPAAS